MTIGKIMSIIPLAIAAIGFFGSALYYLIRLRRLI